MSSAMLLFIIGLLAGAVIIKYMPTNLMALEKEKYSYGIPVPGMKGYIKSPYSDKGYIDARNFAPNTEIKDPYTGKIILVP